jgi:hypothetical protein
MSPDEMRALLEDGEGKPVAETQGDDDLEAAFTAAGGTVTKGEAEPEGYSGDLSSGLMFAADEMLLGIPSAIAAERGQAYHGVPYDKTKMRLDVEKQAFESRNPNAARAIEVGAIAVPSAGLVKAGAQAGAKGLVKAGQAVRAGKGALARGAERAASGYFIRKHVPYQYVPAVSEILKKAGSISPALTVAKGAAKRAGKYTPAAERLLTDFAMHGGGPTAVALRSAMGGGLSVANAMRQAGFDPESLEKELVEYLSEREKEAQTGRRPSGASGRMY